MGRLTPFPTEGRNDSKAHRLHRANIIMAFSSATHPDATTAPLYRVIIIMSAVTTKTAPRCGEQLIGCDCDPDAIPSSEPKDNKES